MNQDSSRDQNALREMIRETVRRALLESPAVAPANESAKPAPAEYVAPWTGVTYDAHPSRQKFDVTEASVTIGELLEFVEAKACTIEKNKPCDQCAMCRSLGF
ncbi:MAG TPA: hypothetical protein PKA34_21765 [Blastocatellia bacterium]|nr:hypothetical protein [Blastocatellia bacterium]